jgi:hypothetical protein
MKDRLKEYFVFHKPKVTSFGNPWNPTVAAIACAAVLAWYRHEVGKLNSGTPIES